MRKRIVLCTLGAVLVGLVPTRAQQPASPIRRIAQVTIVVEDQDQALRYYVDKLGFVKRQDQTMGSFRWLTVSPPEQKDLEVVLEKPSGEMGEARRKQLAMQIGQAPAWVFETPDCKGAYETLKARGVEFVTPPQTLPYGLQAVFKDLYGNTFALVQR
jgi:predicted enzyme related to lactoylglutathione lyase